MYRERMQTTSRHTTRVRIAGVATVVGLALLLTGCIGAYDNSDKAAKELDLSSVGEIQVEAHSGAGVIGGPPPAYEAIVSGEDAYQELFDRLTHLGYELTSEEDDQLQSEWRRTLDDELVKVSVVGVQAGGDILIGNERKPVEEDGIKVTVRSS
jgi:hypothetical protein